MSRTCDAVGCKATVASGRFLCLAHWRLVPVATQRTINSRYRACRADFGFLSDRAYLQACIDAINGIASGEGHIGPREAAEHTSYARLLRIAQRAAEKEERR